jgi:hypothetical protein
MQPISNYIKCYSWDGIIFNIYVDVMFMMHVQVLWVAVLGLGDVEEGVDLLDRQREYEGDCWD